MQATEKKMYPSNLNKHLASQHRNVKLMRNPKAPHMTAVGITSSSAGETSQTIPLLLLNVLLLISALYQLLTDINANYLEYSILLTAIWVEWKHKNIFHLMDYVNV